MLGWFSVPFGKWDRPKTAEPQLASSRLPDYTFVRAGRGEASERVGETNDVDRLIVALPKLELHVHLEGTLEPAMMFELAERNGVRLRYGSVEEAAAAYQFRDLQSFLDLYYEGAGVLIRERDFFDLTWAYLEQMARESVRHVEVFFDPQLHSERGVAFEIVIGGIQAALAQAEASLGITSRLILCFLRDLPEVDAIETFEAARPWHASLAGVGLDSAERGNPPRKFVEVFRRAREAGLACVAHAGEEGPADYVHQALDLLEVRRIDHGVRCVEDDALVERLARERIPLTVCPLSNVRLHVFETLEQHNLKTLLERGLCVTLNSDDPAYFGGYLTENWLATRRALDLDRDQVLTLARNGVEASFLDDAAKQRLQDEIDRVASQTSELVNSTTP